MRKIIDPVAIASVGNYIQKQSDELKRVKNNLLNNIKEISNCYHGHDANIIITKYEERVKKLDIIITNYENYSIYMQNISSAYLNNLNESKKILNKILETTINNNNSNSITVFSNLELSNIRK